MDSPKPTKKGRVPRGVEPAPQTAPAPPIASATRPKEPAPKAAPPTPPSASAPSKTAPSKAVPPKKPAPQAASSKPPVSLTAPKGGKAAIDDDDSSGDEQDDIEQQKDEAIAQAIAQMSGGNMSKKDKAKVAEKAKAMLAPPEPDVASLSHLQKIVGLAFKYVKDEKLDVDGLTRTGIRNYYKVLFSLSRQPAARKSVLAKTHISIFRKIYATYKEKLQDDDLTWLDAGTRAVKTHNPVVLIEYGRKGDAKLPLSALYHFLNDTDVEQIIRDAGDLDFHLWSLFSKLTEDDAEKRKYMELADAAKTSIAPEQEMVGISAGIRDLVLKDKDAVDIDKDSANPEKIIKNVFNQLGNSEEMKQVMVGFTQSAADGTFDIQRVIEVVNQGVRQPLEDEFSKDPSAPQPADGEPDDA
jgi:hypothetical protein